MARSRGNGPTDVRVRFAKLLRERRELLGLRQSDLRDHAGSGTGPHEETVIRWEGGRIPGSPRPDTLTKFEVALSLVSGSLRQTFIGGELVPLGPLLLPAVSIGTRHPLYELAARTDTLVRQIEQEGSDYLLLQARAVRDLVNELQGITSDLETAIRHTDEMPGILPVPDEEPA